jgi:hypothetical protein
MVNDKYLSVPLQQSFHSAVMNSNAAIPASVFMRYGHCTPQAGVAAAWLRKSASLLSRQVRVRNRARSLSNAPRQGRLAPFFGPGGLHAELFKRRTKG